MLVTSKTHHNKCIEYGDCHVGAPGVGRQCSFPRIVTIIIKSSCRYHYMADMQGGLSLATDEEFRHFLVSSPLFHRLAFSLYPSRPLASRTVSHDLNHHFRTAFLLCTHRFPSSNSSMQTMTLAHAYTLAPSGPHNLFAQSTSKFLLFLHTGPDMTTVGTALAYMACCRFIAFSLRVLSKTRGCLL